MLITINILSAMSIVIALFIPYFILLHINNKLRKEVECVTNHLIAVKDYSEVTRANLDRFAKISNQNNKGQDENWENCDKTIELLKEGLSISNEKLKKVDKTLDIHIENTRDAFRLQNKLHDKTIEFMESIERIVNQKQTLKEILENPIEVTKPACETKLKLKEEVNVNDIETVTKIKNKFDFECGILDFKKGYTFQKFSNNIVVHRYGKIHYRFPIKDDYTTVLWEKLLKVNEPKPKRKYTKRTIKNQN